MLHRGPSLCLYTPQAVSMYVRSTPISTLFTNGLTTSEDCNVDQQASVCSKYCYAHHCGKGLLRTQRFWQYLVETGAKVCASLLQRIVSKVRGRSDKVILSSWCAKHKRGNRDLIATWQGTGVYHFHLADGTSRAWTLTC